MARNEQKAMSMLNRWVRMKQQLNKKPKLDRPKQPIKCKTLKSAFHWRQDVLHFIMKKISQIQNAALGEHRIRDLNDQINQLLLEKKEWEKRIKDLGGPDFRAQQADAIDAQASQLPGIDDYKYFGVAKDLPRVRQKLKKTVPIAPKKNYALLHEQIYIDYFGQKLQRTMTGIQVQRDEELEEIQKQWETRLLQQYDPNVRVLQFMQDKNSSYQNQNQYSQDEKITNEEDDEFIADLFKQSRFAGNEVQNTATVDNQTSKKLNQDIKIDMGQIEKLIAERKKQLLQENYGAL